MMLAITLLVTLVLILYVYAGSITYYTGPKSDHFNGKRFFNPYDNGGGGKHRLSDVLKWQFTRDPAVWPDKIEVAEYDIPPASNDAGIRVSYVGHATVLLQVGGINILTDPVWSERASPVAWLGPKRVVDPGIKFDELPKIDLVLISHNHYDHMDKKTIIDLVKRDDPAFVVPLGNDTILKSFAPDIKIMALDWFEAVEYESLNINVVPALHWSSRWMADRNKALWGGFVIETTAGNIYFSGDTGFKSGKVYDIIREKFSSMKLSLIAMGAYKPQWFMEGSHNNPDNAVRAFVQLNSDYGVPIHHGVFKLSDENDTDQINDFNKALDENQVDANNFKLLKVGQHWDIND